MDVDYDDISRVDGRIDDQRRELTGLRRAVSLINRRVRIEPTLPAWRRVAPPAYVAAGPYRGRTGRVLYLSEDCEEAAVRLDGDGAVAEVDTAYLEPISEGD